MDKDGIGCWFFLYHGVLLVSIFKYIYPYIYITNGTENIYGVPVFFFKVLKLVTAPDDK
jgi:hypothetical protein